MDFADLSNWICLLSDIVESPNKRSLVGSNRYLAVKNYAYYAKFIYWLSAMLRPIDDLCVSDMKQRLLTLLLVSTWQVPSREAQGHAVRVLRTSFELTSVIA